VVSWRGLRLAEARQRPTAARSAGERAASSPGQVCGQDKGVPRWAVNTRSMLWFSCPKACTAQSTSPMAEPPHPARMNSGAARWAAAVAGRTATSSGICGPWGCAQSWGTHTVRHSPKCPDGVQPVNLVGKNGRGAGVLPETDPPTQPAATSTTTATTSAAHQGQRLAYRSPDAARAERTPAMVTISRRTHVPSRRAQPHPAP
jgi:hypothetical protein